MEHTSNKKETQLPKFDFNKPIKVTCIFEDSDDTDVEDNSQQAHNKTQSNTNTNSATDQNASLPDHNFYSNVSFEDMEISSKDNVALERNSSAEVNRNGSLETPNTMNATEISNLTLNRLPSNKNENGCLMDVLDCISEILIIITKYHHFYSIPLEENKDAKQHYLQRKFSYYEQSYNAIVTALLPQEHNYAFLRNFVKKTIEIGKRKSWHHSMEFNSIEGLVLDMIQWAKEKKERNSRPQCPVSRSSEASVPPPPPYSTCSVLDRSTTNIQVPVTQVPLASYNVSNEARQPMRPPVSYAQSGQSAMQTVSYFESSANKRLPKNVQIPLRQSTSPLLSLSNYVSNNTWQQGPPVTFAPYERPVQPPAYYVASSANTPQPTNMQTTTSANCSIFNDSRQPRSAPSVSFAPSDMHMQPLPYNMYYNTGQPINRSSQVLHSLTVPSFPPTSNNNVYMRLPNQHQFQSPSLSSVQSPHSTIQSNLQRPALSPSYSYANLNSRQPNRIPPQISHKPSVISRPGTACSIPNVSTRQQMTTAPVSSVSNCSTNSDINKGPAANHDTAVCLFTSGSPGSEISISINADLLNNGTSNKNIRKSPQNRRTKRQNSSGAAKTWIPPTANELQQNNATYNNINQPSTASNAQAAVNTSIQPIIEAAVAALLNVNSSNASEDRICKRRKTDDVEGPTLPTNKDTWIPSMHNGLQHSPMTSNADTTIRTARQPVISPNNLYPGESQNCKRFDNNQSYPPLLSRSESRDSGLGSPVLSALLSSNDMNTVYPRCTDNQEFNPEITHVTSMSPDAVLIANGSCKICGTTTRYKCLACYKEYYCGNECQAKHWPLHMKECKAR